MGIESRTQGRLELELGCRLASESDSCDALILNLGMGGALVRAPLGFAQVGQSLGVEIERPEPEQPLLLMAEVVRVRQTTELLELGMRFLPGPPTLQDELAEFVARLAKTRSGAASPRVHRRVAVHCTAQEQFKATMLDVCSGGLALSSNVECAPGDSISVAIRFDGLGSALELPGDVVSCTREGEESYRVQVRFASLDPEQSERIETLIRLLLLVGGKKNG